jgi:hypothetical protein
MLPRYAPVGSGPSNQVLVYLRSLAMIADTASSRHRFLRVSLGKWSEGSSLGVSTRTHGTSETVVQTGDPKPAEWLSAEGESSLRCLGLGIGACSGF